MRRLLVLAVMLVFVLSLSSFARAGNVTTKKSQGITISGEIRLDAIFQDRESVGIIYNAPGLAPGNPPGSATFVDPRITLNLDVLLARQVSAFLQLRTPPYLKDDFGAVPELEDSAGDTTEYPSRILEVREAYLLIKEFRVPELSVCLGVQNIRYDFTGSGNAFFLGIGECESPFPPAGGGFFNTMSATRDFELWTPGRTGTIEAGGIKVTYRKKAEAMMCEFSLDAFFAITMEGRKDISMGPPKTGDDDQDISGAILTLWVPEAKEPKGSISFLLVSSAYGRDGRIWTYGSGGKFKCSKDFEIFAEAYGQGGKFYDSFDPLSPPPGLFNLSTRAGDIKQLAFAGYGGGRYTFPDTPWQPFVEASYWWVSGDRDNTDRRQQNFLSYEDVNDALIIEDGLYGFDIDTNYEAIKCKAGFKPGKDWELSALYGSFSRARDRRAPDKLGDEFDFNLRWDYTEDTTFKARLGFLTDSDYITEATGHAKVFSIVAFEAVLRF